MAVTVKADKYKDAWKGIYQREPSEAWAEAIEEGVKAGIAVRDVEAVGTEDK